MAPENSKLNQRLTGLELQIKDHTEKIGIFKQGLATLSTQVQSIGDRAVTSWQLLTRVLLPLLGTVLAAALAVYFGLSTQFSNRLPKDIEYGIYTSPFLKDRFAGLDSHFTKIEGRLEEISRTFGLFANTKVLSTAILDATSVPKNQLGKSLPRVRNLLDFAKSSRTPIPSNTYKRASQKLFNHYVASTDPLKKELWEVLAYAVTTRTSTDVALAPVTESEIDQAKKAGNFFEGKIDLSQRTEWKDAIFKNAEITISNPQNELILDNVRFIDCDFHSISQNESDQKLIRNLLADPKPQVSLAINSFRVLTPRFSETSNERKPDTTRLAVK